MKRKIVQTALAVLTALMLATALSACGGGGSSTPATGGSTPVTSGAANLSGSAQ